VRRHDSKLVVFDPMVAYVGETYDTHRDHHVRRVLAPLAELAEELGIAVLVVVHVNKKDARSVLDRVGGSVAFVNAPRSVLAFGAEPEAEEGSSRRVLAHPKSNWSATMPSLALRIETSTIDAGSAKVDTSVAVVEGESTTAASELFVARSAEERSAAEDARQLLEEGLADGPRPRKDIEAAAGAADIKWRTVQRAARSLGVETRREGFGGSTVWSLPASHASRANSRAGETDGATVENRSRKVRSEPARPRSRQHSAPGTNGGANGGERIYDLSYEAGHEAFIAEAKRRFPGSYELAVEECA
jgi:putative DNA primase/helicase